MIRKAGLAGVLPSGRAARSFLGKASFGWMHAARLQALFPKVGTGGVANQEKELINPAFAAPRARGSGLWEEQELKLFIALKQCVHRAFRSPSALQRPGELELLLLFKWFSSCSFSSCHLTARL